MNRSKLLTAVGVLAAVATAIASSPHVAMLDPTVGLVVMLAATALSAANEALRPAPRAPKEDHDGSEASPQ